MRTTGIFEKSTRGYAKSGSQGLESGSGPGTRRYLVIQGLSTLNEVLAHLLQEEFTSSHLDVLPSLMGDHADPHDSRK